MYSDIYNVSLLGESQRPVMSDVAVEVKPAIWTWPVTAEAKSEYLDPKLHRVTNFFGGLDTFPATLRLLRDLDCGAWKGFLKGIGCIWRTLHVRYLHPLRAALPESTAAQFSRLFNQQVCLYIHKLTPPDLRSPALAYLPRMRNLRRSFWSVSELSVARWGSWLMKVRSKLMAELPSAL